MPASAAFAEKSIHERLDGSETNWEIPRRRVINGGNSHSLARAPRPGAEMDGDERVRVRFGRLKSSRVGHLQGRRNFLPDPPCWEETVNGPAAGRCASLGCLTTV